jgi:hypothetical protein
MFVVLALVAVGRLQLLNFPLERDEGEYAYAGQLILQGIPPYELAYNMKFPGTYLAYAAIMAGFGETPFGIHFGLLLVTTATAVMLYWLGKRLLDALAGAVAASSYAVMAASTAMFGNAAHATIFGACCVVAGLCLLTRCAESKGDAASPKVAAVPPPPVASRGILDIRAWSFFRPSTFDLRHCLRPATAGFMFGLAILMKQHALFIALWAGLLLLAWSLRRKELRIGQRALPLLAFAAGVLLPFGWCCGWLWHAGVFGKFWFWTIDYARAYVAINHREDILRQLSWSLHSIFADCWLWWFAVAGCGVIWLDGRLRSVRGWLAGLVVASGLTTVPGFYFRTHYFHLVLPVAALLAGCAVSGGVAWLRHPARGKRWWPVPVALYVSVLTAVLIHDADVVAVLSRVGGHALHGLEPVPESQVVAAYIQSQSPAMARVAVLGSEPQIYFYSHRHSATGYIYIYGLMEPQPFAMRMQHEMMAEIETNAPEFVVYSTIDSSWQRRPDSVRDIFNWWAAYRTNYDLVGVAEVSSLVETHYYWDADAARHGPLKGVGLELYRRRAASAK